MIKRGTPTMGGVLIVGSVFISTLLWARLSSFYVWTAIIATLLFGAIGFVDDYSKMAKQRSLGLTGRQKLLAQLLVAYGVWAVLFYRLSFSAALIIRGTSVFRFSKSPPIRGKSLYRSLFISATDRRCVAGVVQRGKFDRRPGWSGDQRHFHRDDSVDGFYLSQQRCALGQIPGIDSPAGSSGVDGFLRSDGGREPRLPLVQRATRAGFHGRRRQPGHRRRNRNGGSADEAGIHVVDGGWSFCDRSVVSDVAGERLQDDKANDGHRAAVVQDDAAASPLRDAGLERVEDRLSIFDSGDPVCVVESVDAEVTVSMGISDCRWPSAC